MNRNRSVTMNGGGGGGDGVGDGLGDGLGGDAVGGLDQWLDRRGLGHTLGVLTELGATIPADLVGLQRGHLEGTMLQEEDKDKLLRVGRGWWRRVVKQGGEAGW